MEQEKTKRRIKRRRKIKGQVVVLLRFIFSLKPNNINIQQI
jgi:hypothetical protein